MPDGTTRLPDCHPTDARSQIGACQGCCAWLTGLMWDLDDTVEVAVDGVVCHPGTAALLAPVGPITPTARPARHLSIRVGRILDGHLAGVELVVADTLSPTGGFGSAVRFPVPLCGRPSVPTGDDGVCGDCCDELLDTATNNDVVTSGGTVGPESHPAAVLAVAQDC